MVNRYRIAAVTLAVVVLFAAGAAAQDYYYTNFKFGHQDHVLPAAPCALEGPAQFFTFDRSIWVGYTCADGKVIARRHFHPSDSVREPLPVILHKATPSADDHDPGDGRAVYCTGIGMVPGVYGGCVSADHPNAKR